MQSTASNCTTIEITPVITAASAYAAGNQVGGIQTLPAATLEEGRYGQLVKLDVLDLGKQKAALTVFFFDTLPTITSTDKTAFSLTTAQFAAKSIGQITVAAASYQDSALASVATNTFSGLFLKSKFQGTLYAVAMTTGTPTYLTASDLIFKYVFAKSF